MVKFFFEDALYSLVVQFNNRIISQKDFCRTFLDQIHPFRDGKGRTHKILFVDQIKKYMNNFSALDKRA